VKNSRNLVILRTRKVPSNERVQILPWILFLRLTLELRTMLT
jgi:hypothetical protein